VEREAVHRLSGSPGGRPAAAPSPRELIVSTRGGHDASLSVAMRHRRHAAHEIPEIVGEVDVVALVVPLPREIAVAAERHFLHEVEPQRVLTETVGRIDGIDQVAEVSCSCAGRSAS